MRIPGGPRKAWLLMSAAALAAGTLGWVGPGEAIDHQLHKWDIKPYFYECCCANEDHSECAWGDHFGGNWMNHHPGISRAGLLVMVLAAFNGLAALASGRLAGPELAAVRGRRGEDGGEIQSQADLAEDEPAADGLGPQDAHVRATVAAGAGGGDPA
ncbi:MAG: hypothetical protein ACYTGB_16545 [Planctomycetota bacterium]